MSTSAARDLTPLLRRCCLLSSLAATLLLRLPGIGWGLPPDTPQVIASGLRSSYAFDEDDILSGAAKGSVSRLDFDPRDYHWGTLHGELELLVLDAAGAAGVFGRPWRAAYYNLVDGAFVRVYEVGRMVAVAGALLTVWLLSRFPGAWVGAFAAMLVAVSPSHLLQSDQVRVDVTMTAMVVLTLLIAIRSTADGRPFRFLLLGIAAGLAIAGKYSAVSVVAAIAFAALSIQRIPWRGTLAVVGGALLGFMAGSPYVLIRWHEYYKQIGHYAVSTANIPPEYVMSTGKLLTLHAVDLARFSMGLPALLLALAGIVCMLRRRLASDWVILAAIAGYVAILPPLRWVLLRYELPLIVLFGLCAGVALERLSSRWRPWLTAAALIMPLAGSIAQINYMRSPHPANLMLQRILETVPRGSAITRLFLEAPPLDRKVYPMGTNLFTGDLSRHPPSWVLTSDLPDEPFPASNVAYLRSNYEEVARIESRRILAWATFGEAGAPHDWKYTHSGFVLFRKKQS